MCGTDVPRVKGCGRAVHAPVTNAGYVPGVVAAREPDARVAPGARAAAPARRPARIRGARSSPPRPSCSPSAASAARRWRRSPAAAACSSRRSTTTSAARASCSTRSSARRTARRSSSSARVRAAGGSPAVQLYRVIRADVAALCALPYDLNEIHRLAARDRGAFARYWTEREHLVDELAAIVSEGVDRGELRTVDPRLTALTLMSNDEGTQNWLRVAGRDGEPVHAGGRGAPRGRVRSSPTSPCAGCSSRPRDLDRVRRAPTRSTPPPSSPDAAGSHASARTRQTRETGACFERPSTETAQPYGARDPPRQEVRVGTRRAAPRVGTRRFAARRGRGVVVATLRA